MSGGARVVPCLGTIVARRVSTCPIEATTQACVRGLLKLRLSRVVLLLRRVLLLRAVLLLRVQVLLLAVLLLRVEVLLLAVAPLLRVEVLLLAVAPLLRVEVLLLAVAPLLRVLVLLLAAPLVGVVLLPGVVPLAAVVVLLLRVWLGGRTMLHGGGRFLIGMVIWSRRLWSLCPMMQRTTQSARWACLPSSGCLCCACADRPHPWSSLAY